jgi:two-component system invasion response regulator UvrY
MNVLILDDHDVIRQSMELIIVSEFPKAACVKVENAAACIEILKKQSFDLLILDMNLPDMDGITLTEWIRNRYPRQKILVFSMNPADVYGRRLYQMGVMGYLSKQADVSEIKRALRIVLGEGKQYMDEEFKAMLTRDFLNNSPANPVEKLSKRELTIAQLLAQGKTFEEIAGQLNIESSTIRTYKARIFNKLDVTTLHDFLAKAKIYKLA